MEIQRSLKNKPFLNGNRLSFYAALYNEPTSITEKGETFTEIIKPGAFDTMTNDVRLTINHREDTTFAKRSTGLLLANDPKGLFVSDWIDNDEVKRSYEAGEIVGASFWARNVQYNHLPNNTKEIVSAELVDVCLSQLPERPAYRQTEGEIVLRNNSNMKKLLRRLRLIKIKLNNI